MTSDDAFRLGHSHFQAGRLAEAETLYRQILRENPAHFPTLQEFGVMAIEAGKPHIGLDLLRRAVALRPNDAPARVDLGRALEAFGKYEESLAAIQEAIRLEPQFPAAYFNLARILQSVGRNDDAIAAYRAAIRLDPSFVLAHLNLGLAFRNQGMPREALASWEQVLRIDPSHADALNNRAIVLQNLARLDEAIAAFRKVLEIKPGSALAHNNLAVALHAKGDLEGAASACRAALRLDPFSIHAHYNLGNALQAKGLFDEACAAFLQTLSLAPDHALAWNNLANCHKDQGRLDAAIDCFRRAISADPRAADLHSNLVYSIHFHPDYDAAAILAENLQWDQRHAQPLQPLILRHANDRDTDRRLRIGYISPDFCRHVVGQNLLPFFREHDHALFEIFCYSGVVSPDTLTAEFQSLSDHWREIAPLSDEEAAAEIRADGIDILVDLSVHMAGNRLPVFARKPAPIQATYLGYCSTTGMAAMDYRFSDPHLDPPGTDLSVYREQTVRLPQSYWCYQPRGPTPQIGPLPAVSSGTLTFGCLNNFAKVSPTAFDLWMELLEACPHARLLLYTPPGSARQLLSERLARRGLSPNRLEFAGPQPWEDYLQSLQRIDIALDPFPYAGGITTCDALWMGVPVVTLSGRTAVSRAGRSILSNLGLPDLIAETPSQYLEIALSLAADLPRLIALRAGLRDRMERSPLRDSQSFARAIEAAYRQMWWNWSSNAGDDRQ